MKNSRIAKILLILLNIFFYLGVATLIIMIVGCFVSLLSSNFTNLPRLSLIAFIGSLYMLIIFLLRKIVKSICDRKPFSTQNVKRLINISYIVFVLSIIDLIINFTKHSNIEILATRYGSIKLSFFMYLVLGFFALVMSQIFNEALKIKDENDLTI